MRILAIEREAPVVDDHAFTPELLQAEAQRAWELYQEGIVRELYFRADRTEAVILLECDSVEEAAAALDTLPLVQAGLVAFEFLPLRAYPGFARLFAKTAA
jgi:muconolactone delta-isomerase